MLTKNELEKEFQAFNIIWGLWKYADEVQIIDSSKEEELWKEIMAKAIEVEKIIGRSDKEKLDAFCEMANSTVIYLEKLRKRR